MKRLLITVLSISLVLFYISVAQAANELVLHLSFDETSGTVAKDSSKLKNDCTFKGGTPKWVKGKFGNAAELDGKTWGEVPNSPSIQITDALTIEGWVKVTEKGGTHQSLVEKGSAWKDGEYNLLAHYDGKGILLQMEDLPADCADTNQGSSVIDDQWHFIAGTWDGKTLQLYIDGKADKSKPCAGKLNTNNDPIFIGARGGTGRFLLGSIDEVKVYNYALSAAEIKADMDNPSPVATSVDPKSKLAVTWGSLKQR
jgi:hypothetical protein